uniref:Uncharacterized protein n=1 Tax=Triticum urartu TaxID=4572 RepID=A0A8R7U537_TRIUA
MGLSTMYSGSNPTSLTMNSILRRSFSSDIPRMCGLLRTATRTLSMEQPRVLLKNSILAATLSSVIEHATPTAYLNMYEERGTPSFSARSTNAFTRSGLNTSSLEQGVDSLTISQTLSPHCSSSAMLGLATFSRSVVRMDLFLFMVWRSLPKEPKKGIQNSSLGVMSHDRRAVAPTRRKLAISGAERPRRSRRAERRGATLSTLERRSSGSAATTAAMSGRERPTPERRASTASGLEADLRWQSFLDALSAWARVRPQVTMRYSSVENGVVEAERARRRWRE